MSPQAQKNPPAHQTSVPATGKAPAGKAPAKATPPNPDLQIIVPSSRSTGAAISTGITGIQTTSSNWGFAPLQTLSGHSLGSLTQHSMDWNVADSAEVSSGGLPLGPSLLAQKMFAVKATVQEADQVAKVKFYSVKFLQNRYLTIPSPRDSG